MSGKPLYPKPPFIWPDTRAAAGEGRAVTAVPFESLILSSSTVFGVVSAIDRRAVDWMEGFLADRQDAKLRIVLSIYPTSRTTSDDLEEIKRLAERHGDKAKFRIFPEQSLTDRSSNFLAFVDSSSTRLLVTGPTENIGFDTTTESQANLVTAVSNATFEACRKWFDVFFANSAHLTSELIAMLPQLVLPPGQEEAARDWRRFREHCIPKEAVAEKRVHLVEDPETGETILVNERGEPVDSTTEEAGVPVVEKLVEEISLLYEQGLLVTISDRDRIPPLAAPVKPEWFDVKSLRTTGAVAARTTMKISPFEEQTLKEVNEARALPREHIIPKFTFKLSRGVRWIPKSAVELFEEELLDANAEVAANLGLAVDGDAKEFLQRQRKRIDENAQEMYRIYHPNGVIPIGALSQIYKALETRLEALSGRLIPTVTYSPITFSVDHSSEWSSSWDQALELIIGIAKHPRVIITRRGFDPDPEGADWAHIVAMNVADDFLVASFDYPVSRDTAKKQLRLINGLEHSSASTEEQCRALWALIRRGDTGALEEMQA
jgi:hypothetical protein